MPLPSSSFVSAPADAPEEGAAAAVAAVLDVAAAVAAFLDVAAAVAAFLDVAAAVDFAGFFAVADGDALAGTEAVLRMPRALDKKNKADSKGVL
jgi:hypothetical protein